MSETLPAKWNWARAAIVAAVVHLATVVPVGIVYVITKGIQTDGLAVAMTGVNDRLTAISAKLDALPVMQEKLAQAQAAINDGRGAYSSLDVRLRAIESNSVINHTDIERERARTDAHGR